MSVDQPCHEFYDFFPSIATMSLSCVEQEHNCVQSWFRNWSPWQRNKFMEELLCKAVPANSADLLLDSIDSLTLQGNTDRGPSLFQCQLKLFRQWFDNWQDKERNQFLAKLQEVDSDFVVQFQQAVDHAEQKSS